MPGRLWTLAVACSLASLVACSSKEDSHTTDAAPPPTVRISASAATVVANGTNTVTITVTNTGTGTVMVTTSRGNFQGTGSTAVVAGAIGTLTLVTCSGAGCPGTATITATGTAGTASTTVTFASLASACQTNCAVDVGCQTLACDLGGGAVGACSSTAPSACVVGVACTQTAATETSCGDGIDDDCNGFKDCKDTACDGQACLAGSPTFVCKAGACTDITSGLSVTVTPARGRLPANGAAQTEVVVDVASSGDPQNAMTVTVATTLGTITPAAAATGSDGKAHFTFTSSAGAGVATITAQLQAVPSVKGTAIVTMPRLGSLNLVTGNPGSVEFPVMGAIGSGFQEFGWVQVVAVDDVGLPYPDGLAVQFEHHQLGGSTLRGPFVPCLVPSASCVGYQGTVSSGAGTPDTTGLANAWIYSGRVAGTLAVTATASAGSGPSFVTRTVALPTIAVFGAKASGANFGVVCSPRNLPALAEPTCAISYVDAPFTCEAILKDRFSNVLGRATHVFFQAEASTVGQITTTKDYDPTLSGDAQMDLGIAVQSFNTLLSNLPFDVDPLTTLGEPSVVHALDGCGLRTHNPRDGVVTIIAIADGEEAFFDANGNGSYDVGEPFVDLGEPFIDQNDNGVWDPGESFQDLDDNGTWTPPNGRWDANTKIWTQTFVVYTGEAATMVDGSGNLLGTRIADWGGFPGACTATPPPAPFDVHFASTTAPPVPATSQDYVVVASDMNLNFLTMKTAYGVDFKPSDADIKVDYAGDPSYTDIVGMDWRYWACANGGAGPCASQCRATGGAAPCLMVPEFTRFWCGLTSSITVSGNTQPAKATVRWNVTVPWDRYGTGAIRTTRATVSGQSTSPP